MRPALLVACWLRLRITYLVATLCWGLPALVRPLCVVKDHGVT